ncbi:MAG: glycine cleavage system protein H [Deltaproteobacteria bacterium]|nr:glycine cleavage system protein H [Deltaproteobacteria bacterium]
MNATSLILALVALGLALLALVFLLPRRNLLPRAPEPRPGVPGMRPPHLPSGTFLDAGHTWLRIAPDGSLRIGVDAFLAEALGRVERVHLPAPGRWVGRGEALLELELGGRRLRLFSPVEGEVQRVNEALEEQPGRLTDDPYGNGWALTIWSRNHKAAIRPLKIGPVAVSFLRRELEHLLDFLPRTEGRAASPLLADGGLPRRGVLAELGERGWPLFQQEFLDPVVRRASPP